MDSSDAQTQPGSGTVDQAGGNQDDGTQMPPEEPQPGSLLNGTCHELRNAHRLLELGGFPRIDCGGHVGVCHVEQVVRFGRSVRLRSREMGGEGAFGVGEVCAGDELVVGEEGQT